MVRSCVPLFALGLALACSCSAADPEVRSGGGAGSSAAGAKNQASTGKGGTSNGGAGSAQANATTVGGNPNPATSAGGASGGANGVAGSGQLGSDGTNDSGLPALDAANNGSGNLAMGHCYREGCTAQWKEDPCVAFDGDKATVTGAAKTWVATEGDLVADLGQVQDIGKVVVNYDTNGSDPNPGHTIDVSTDDVTWSTVKDVDNPGLVDTQDGLNASGRYVRVHLKHFFFDPWWVHSVSEIEVSGK